MLTSPPKSDPTAPPQPLSAMGRFIGGYFWFVLKNVIGWILILGAFPVGVTLPGPGGIPLFLIGFALVSFPGKRRLTSRVMRGRPMRVEPGLFMFLVTVASILITTGVLWFVRNKYKTLLGALKIDFSVVEFAGICALAAGVTWLVMRLGLALLNFILHHMPRARRAVRPWLRKRGINLLPPRRRRSVSPGAVETRPEDEIVEFHESYHSRLRDFWDLIKLWLRRLLSVGITVAIFYMMLSPLAEPDRWAIVREQIGVISAWRFVVASFMFALFLFVFRAVSWRRILKGFGHRLPVAAATRIWSTSELARYLPGAIWQVVGRVYLCKPYGISGSIVSTSQILELCVFLLANVIVTGCGLLYFGAKIDPQARPWLITALALIPLMSLLLHPKVFYGLANRVLARLGKPAIVTRLRGRKLVALLGWMIVGLLWQSLAVYVIVAPVLGLKIDWWWMVASAYCLAWCAGFLAIWAPGGIGVRELVFVVTMQLVLPEQVRQSYDPAAFKALLVLLGFALRLWSVVGELILTGAACLVDLDGATGRHPAPAHQAAGKVASMR
ncbi:MAG: lysylphosphatidylglycerol synthase transmembrane domain-containing protein [Tepidisphaeraceae bacterium]